MTTCLHKKFNKLIFVGNHIDVNYKLYCFLPNTNVDLFTLNLGYRNENKQINIRPLSETSDDVKNYVVMYLISK